MKYIISAGGTGGHIYPALSIISKIKEEDKKAKILYIGTTDRMEKDIVPNMQIDYEAIQMNGLSNSPKMLFRFIKNTISGIKKCKKIMKKFKPDIVIGVGGYITVPVVLAAHKLKIKVVLHEQNSIPGKSNLVLSRYADSICVSMESSKKYFKDQTKVALTGNPRGEEILKFKKGNKKDYDLSIEKKLVLITMGSLGASTINNKIVELLSEFENKPYEVLLVTGKDNYDEIANTKLPKNVKITPYIEKMGEVLKFTDLIVTRAGATIIAEITSLGLPSILIPSPYVANNHQEINAKIYAKNGAGIVVLEDNFNIKSFQELFFNLIKDTEKLQEMAKNAKNIAVIDADVRIVDVVKDIIKTNNLMKESKK